MPDIELHQALSRGCRVLVASDFDGTLCPIADRPEQVRVAPEMLDILRRLAESERTRLAVLSGRTLADVSSYLPVSATFAGNHGLEIRGPGYRFQHPEARRLRPELEVACGQLREVVTVWPGAWVEDKGLSVAVHYRNVVPNQQGPLVRAVSKAAKPFGSEFALRPAKKLVELYPRVHWDKGEALRFIQQRFGPFDACLCIGDDQTDEAMFRANYGQWNIKVGPGSTTADYYLPDPSAVAVFLESLAGGGEAGPEAATYSLPKAVRV